MVRSRFGEVCSCCCLPALPGPAWVPLIYVLRTILCTSVAVDLSRNKLTTKAPSRRLQPCSLCILPSCLLALLRRNCDAQSGQNRSLPGAEAEASIPPSLPNGRRRRPRNTSLVAASLPPSHHRGQYSNLSAKFHGLFGPKY